MINSSYEPLVLPIVTATPIKPSPPLSDHSKRGLFAAIFAGFFFIGVSITTISSSNSLVVVIFGSNQIFAGPLSRSIPHVVAVPSIQTPSLTQTEDRNITITEKKILLWFGFFSDNKWTGVFGGLAKPPYIDPTNDNLNNRCSLTTDRAHLSQAHAVVFHGRNFDFNDLPKSRSPWQRWAMFNMESPPHNGFDHEKWQRANELGINWTMSYLNTKADIKFSYGLIVPAQGIDLRTKTSQIDEFVNSFPNRSVDAVWIVGNCGAASRRQDLVHRLAEFGIITDIWGGCGPGGRKPDGEWNRVGKANFFARYRFYLSFENSYCDDYVTEKFFNGMKASLLGGAIPIVYGSADYTKLAPSGSFIDVRSFNSTRDLASHLKSLRELNMTDTVRSFYQWHYTHDVQSFGDWTLPGFQNLCSKLFDDENVTSTVSDLEKSFGECHPIPSVVTN